MMPSVPILYSTQCQNDWWPGVDLKGSGHGIIQLLSWPLIERTEENHKKICKENQCLQLWLQPSTSWIQVLSVTSTSTLSSSRHFIRSWWNSSSQRHKGTSNTIPWQHQKSKPNLGFALLVRKKEVTLQSRGWHQPMSWNTPIY
jgi:hypothetical protein